MAPISGQTKNNRSNMQSQADNNWTTVTIAYLEASGQMQITLIVKIEN